ncbi:MAG: zinc ribbon domain-containing protein [Acidobacteriota bacterium]
MQSDLVKLCPRCGSEYQMWVERCLDCDTTLVHGREGEAEEGREEPSHDTWPQDAVYLRMAPPLWIGRLSEDLDEAGIRHWVSPPEWKRDPRLFVLPADLEAAIVIDRKRYDMEMPEVEAAEEDARPQRPARRRAASSYDHDVKVCPSCGGEYQLWVETCADCGVPVVRPWDLDSAREAEPRMAVATISETTPLGVCPACGDPLPEGALDCPGCGLTLSQPDACPNCGAELEAYTSSCRRCGFELFGGVEGGQTQ